MPGCHRPPPVDRVVPFPKLAIAPVDTGFYRRCGKRALDCIAAALGLLLLAPLLLILALVVKVSSRGPVCYWQDRVGRGGQIFHIVKFRSMFEDADKRGLAITTSVDPRVTPVGRMLRQLKLDELPQLWNVLKGEMSLVGPRPEVPGYLEAYSAAQRRVLAVRPGITDPASIAYRREQELLAAQPDPDRYYREVVLPDKLNMNLEYLANISFSYDLQLILLTTGSIFSSRSS
jgi:lipopolysaccharide/colanic/teichoic acid biosynthesis glycosyltransferase